MAILSRAEWLRRRNTRAFRLAFAGLWGLASALGGGLVSVACSDDGLLSGEPRADAGDAAPDRADAPLLDAGRDASDGEGGRDAGLGALTICDRIVDPDRTIGRMNASYLGDVRADCRVAGLVNAMPLFGWADEILHFNLRFLGCILTPVGTFALAPSIVTPTSAEAEILIDIYIARARRELDLSRAEEAEIRTRLEAMATVFPQSETLNYDRCDAGTDGGADGGDAAPFDDAGEPDGGGDASSDIDADAAADAANEEWS